MSHHRARARGRGRGHARPDARPSGAAARAAAKASHPTSEIFLKTRATANGSCAYPSTGVAWCFARLPFRCSAWKHTAWSHKQSVRESLEITSDGGLRRWSYAVLVVALLAPHRRGRLALHAEARLSREHLRRRLPPVPPAVVCPPLGWIHGSTGGRARGAAALDVAVLIEQPRELRVAPRHLLVRELHRSPDARRAGRDREAGRVEQRVEGGRDGRVKDPDHERYLLSRAISQPKNPGNHKQPRAEDGAWNAGFRPSHRRLKKLWAAPGDGPVGLEAYRSRDEVKDHASHVPRGADPSVRTAGPLSFACLAMKPRCPSPGR